MRAIISLLFHLPGTVVTRPDPAKSASTPAQRNLLRHLTLSLRSGQRAAQAMKVPALSEIDLAMLKPFGMDDGTPLWFYILREAAVKENGGERLSPFGARPVTEVFILLKSDSSSFLSQDTSWELFLPAIDPNRQHEDFQIIGLLRLDGVA